MAAINNQNYKKTNNHKLVFLGDSAVGKSCIVSRFIRGDFSEFQEPTIGAAFNTGTIELEDIKIRFEIWDTAGQERYRSLAPMYYRGASAAVIVYDITNIESFEGAKLWVSEIKRRGNSECIISIIGNKSDLKDNRKVSVKKVTEYADTNNISYMEVSAKAGVNINNMFENIAKRIPTELSNNTNKSTKLISSSSKRRRSRIIC